MTLAQLKASSVVGSENCTTITTNVISSDVAYFDSLKLRYGSHTAIMSKLHREFMLGLRCRGVNASTPNLEQVIIDLLNSQTWKP